MVALTTEFASGQLEVSFQPDEHEDRIRSVSIGVAVDDYNYSTFVDPTGTVRRRPFDMAALGLSVSDNSVINVCVGIEDQDGNIWTTKLSRLISNELGRAAVTNIRAATRTDGSGMVDVWYDYNGSKEIQAASVSLVVNTLDGEQIPCPSTRGDIGDGVRTGQNRRIIWDARKDLSGMGRTPLRVLIYLVDEESGVAGGDSVSGPFMFDPGWDSSPYVVRKPAASPKHGVQDGSSAKDYGIAFEPLRSSSSSSSVSRSSSSSSSRSTTSRSSSSRSTLTSTSSGGLTSSSSSSRSSASSSMMEVGCYHLVFSGTAGLFIQPLTLTGRPTTFLDQTRDGWSWSAHSGPSTDWYDVAALMTRTLLPSGTHRWTITGVYDAIDSAYTAFTLHKDGDSPVGDWIVDTMAASPALSNFRVIRCESSSSASSASSSSTELLGANCTPVMTGYESPAPYKVEDYNRYDDHEGWMAFDYDATGGANNSWWSAVYEDEFTWVDFDFGIQKYVRRYSITAYSAITSPRTLSLVGFNDPGSPVTLDSQSLPSGWVGTLVFNITQPGNYRHYMLVCGRSGYHVDACPVAGPCPAAGWSGTFPAPSSDYTLVVINDLKFYC